MEKLDALRQKTAFICDMDGVIYHGNRLLKYVPEFVAWLQNSQANPPPGGERIEDFTARVSSAFDGIVREMMRERVQSAAVIVGGGVLTLLMAAVALPRLQLHEWATAPGHGYTLLTSAQLWMQGGCAEAFATVPVQEG